MNKAQKFRVGYEGLKNNSVWVDELSIGIFDKDVVVKDGYIVIEKEEDVKWHTVIEYQEEGDLLVGYSEMPPRPDGKVVLVGQLEKGADQQWFKPAFHISFNHRPNDDGSYSVLNKDMYNKEIARIDQVLAHFCNMTPAHEELCYRGSEEEAFGRIKALKKAYLNAAKSWDFEPDPTPIADSYI